MVKSATVTLLACAASAFIAGGCKNKEPETGNLPLQEIARPAAASGLSKLIASLEPLARDMDLLLKKME